MSSADVGTSFYISGGEGLAFDRERFLKCRALMDRGATEGERAAGRAAASRVASSAGFTLDQAMRLVDGMPEPVADADEFEFRTYRREPKREPTVAEFRARRDAHAARVKRTGDRKRRREERHPDPDQEAWAREAREAQAERDREWRQSRET